LLAIFELVAFFLAALVFFSLLGVNWRRWRGFRIRSWFSGSLFVSALHFTCDCELWFLASPSWLIAQVHFPHHYAFSFICPVFPKRALSWKFCVRRPSPGGSAPLHFFCVQLQCFHIYTHIDWV